MGHFTITASKFLRISNLVATDGDYDPSNNNGSFGTIILNSDGSLTESLSDGEKVRVYNLVPKN